MSLCSDWNDLYNNINELKKFKFDEGINCNTLVKKSFFSSISDSVICYDKRNEIIIYVNDCTFVKVSSAGAGSVARAIHCQYYQSNACIRLCYGYASHESHGQCLDISGESFINSSLFFECGQSLTSELLSLDISFFNQINATEVHVKYNSFLNARKNSAIEYLSIVKSFMEYGSIILGRQDNHSLKNCDFINNNADSSFFNVYILKIKICLFSQNNIEKESGFISIYNERCECENCYFEGNNFTFNEKVIWNGVNASSLENNFEFHNIQNCYSIKSISSQNQECCNQKIHVSCGCQFVFSDQYLSVISLVILSNS